MGAARAVTGGIAAAALPLALAVSASAWLGVLEDPDTPASSDLVLSDPAELESRRRARAAERLWWGNEIAQRFNDVERLPLDVRDEERDRGRERRIEQVIENVSPALRRLLDLHDGKLVFHEGRATELDDCADLKGQPTGLYKDHVGTYDTCVGLYRWGTRTAFVQTDRPLARVRHTYLHELGHMLDHALGEPSGTDAFDRVLTHDDALADLGYPERVDFRDRKRSEYFAESFADYHMSGQSRLWMRSERPAAARYWDDLVRRENERRHREVEIAVGVALRRMQASSEPRAAAQGTVRRAPVRRRVRGVSR